jgi:3-oxoadipate enol-lactonase
MPNTATMIAADDGAKLNVQVDGREGAPVLMFSNSLGTNLHMWDEQTAALGDRFHIIRYDRRGHGKSDAPKGPYTMERLGLDVLSILNALKIDKINWCGLSMGGMVGQWLGVNAPQRINKLILSNTSACYVDKAPWNDRIKTVREKGLASMVDGNMLRWFTPGFVASAPKAIAKMKEMFVATPPEGYIACCEAIRDMDFRDSNPKISVPTLVIVGAHDPATTPAVGEALCKSIPGAQMVTLDASHISNVEQPRAYTDAVVKFIG